MQRDVAELVLILQFNLHRLVRVISGINPESPGKTFGVFRKFLRTAFVPEESDEVSKFVLDRVGGQH